MLASPQVAPFGGETQFGSPSGRFGRPLFMGSLDSVSDGEQYPNVGEMRDTIQELEGQLETQREMNVQIEQSYQKLGQERMHIENELAETRRTLLQELEEQKRSNTDLSTKLDLAERANAKLKDDVARMTREVLGVMKVKREMTQTARRDARKQFADEERIRNELSREQRRHEKRTRSPSNPPQQLVQQQAQIPMLQDPQSVRAVSAFQELQDFFDF